MKINYISGDMFSSKEASVFVHQVNCQGVMGSGIARVIREKWPEVYHQYQTSVKTLSGNCLGGCLVVDTKDGKRVANLFGQYYYRGFKPDEDYLYDEFWKQPEITSLGQPIRYTNYEAFYSGLVRLREYLQYDNPTTIAFPYNIGCDRGGGSWNIIDAMIKEVFKDTNHNIEIWKL
jgi:O-acetyl-ADP-ribose deacetylase (regulator of RNase III)